MVLHNETFPKPTQHLPKSLPKFNSNSWKSMEIRSHAVPCRAVPCRAAPLPCRGNCHSLIAIRQAPTQQPTNEPSNQPTHHPTNQSDAPGCSPGRPPWAPPPKFKSNYVRYERRAVPNSIQIQLNANYVRYGPQMVGREAGGESGEGF